MAAKRRASSARDGIGGIVHAILDGVAADRKLVEDAMDADDEVTEALASFIRRGTVQQALAKITVQMPNTASLGPKLGAKIVTSKVHDVSFSSLSFSCFHHYRRRGRFLLF